MLAAKPGVPLQLPAPTPLAILTVSLLICEPARAAESFAGQRFHFGDLHVHTGASGDGSSSDLGGGCPEVDDVPQHCGAVADLATTATDNGLDFLATTDHANSSQAATAEDFEWVLWELQHSHDPDGGFVTIPGGELWVRHGGKLGGHLNLYFFAESDALNQLRLHDFAFAMDGEIPSDDAESCGALWRWMAELEAAWGPVLLLPHHPQMGGGMATNWACHSHVYPESRRYLPAVEVYSRHGDSTVFPTSYDPLWHPDEDQQRDLSAALDPTGWALRLGLLGGTDAHDTLPGSVCNNARAYRQQPYGGGLTAAVLDEGERFDREALYQAIVDRRTYATSGPRLPVSLEARVDDELVGTMGEVIELPAAAEVELRVSIPTVHEHSVLGVVLRTPDAELPLEATGPGTWAGTLSPQERPDWAYPVLKIDGIAWYGEANCDDGGTTDEERVWLSPVWLEPQPGVDGHGDTGWDEPGCRGCAGRTGGAGWWLVLAGAFAAALRRVRRS